MDELPQSDSIGGLLLHALLGIHQGLPHRFDIILFLLLPDLLPELRPLIIHSTH
jgi:hypothetical protein